MHVIFNLTTNSNDKRTLLIKTKTSNDIDELFDLLIKNHEEYSKSLKTIGLQSKGVESVDISLEQQTVNTTYIQSPQWLTSKKCTINPQNKNNWCFQYSIAAVLNHQKINHHLERILKIKPFINNFNLDETNFQPQQQDYEKIETDNKSIELIILHVPHNTENIEHL